MNVTKCYLNNDKSNDIESSIYDKTACKADKENDKVYVLFPMYANEKRVVHN